MHHVRVFKQIFKLVAMSSGLVQGLLQKLQLPRLHTLFSFCSSFFIIFFVLKDIFGFLLLINILAIHVKLVEKNNVMTVFQIVDIQVDLWLFLLRSQVVTLIYFKLINLNTPNTSFPQEIVSETYNLNCGNLANVILTTKGMANFPCNRLTPQVPKTKTM